jgi:hypothetical protein
MVVDKFFKMTYFILCHKIDDATTNIDLSFSEIV